MRSRPALWLAGLAIASAAAFSVAAVTIPLIAGWRAVVITSGSMTPAIHRGDVVVARPHPGDSLKPGTVVVFREADGALVIHRIAAVNRDGTYRSRGDANALPDSTPLRSEQVVGVGRLLVPRIGAPILLVRQAGSTAFVALALLVAGAAAARLRTSAGRSRADRAAERATLSPGLGGRGS